jgi:L-fuconolactonase
LSIEPSRTLDAHVHFWRYDPVEYAWIDDSFAALRRDFLPADAAANMRAAHVDGCIAVQVRQTVEETRWFLQLAAEYPFIEGVVGWVDLRAPDLDAQLQELTADRKLVGIRHIVQSEADGFLSAAPFRRGVARLARYGLTYDILVYARQLPEAIEFAAALPEARLVLDHLGKPDIRGGAFDSWRRDLDRLAALPHVVAKLSGLVTEADWRGWRVDDLHRYIGAALDSFGPERLMIGSDWPVCTVAAEYAEVLDVVHTALAVRTAAERHAVLGGTARRFWNLPDVSSLEHST